MFKALLGILIPFFGTALGAATVFFLKKDMDRSAKGAICGFAGGVMLAASVWSLLLPAIDLSSHLGTLSFLPALIGLSLGVAMLCLIDLLAPIGVGAGSALPLAVTVHNFPEGMAVGVVYAQLLLGEQGVSFAGALALSVGIGIQNFPEGAIISLPMHAGGKSKFRSFACGVLSGVVEPLGAALLIVASGLLSPLLPYVLAFAAGAMIYVVVKELIPEATANDRSSVGTLAFVLGFALMMTLDVALS